MLINLILITFSILLILKIIFTIKEIEVLKFILTPLTTLSIISIPLFVLYNNKSNYAILILAGLIFSLIGDIFNMLEEGSQKKLQYGLIFFFFAHLIYIKTFFSNYVFAYYHIAIFVLVVIILLFTYFIFKKNFKTIIIKLGISPYMIAVSATMILAIGNLNAINTKALLISTGAIMFWLSDLVLGVDAFYKKLKFNALYIWGLYAPGQLLIALSCYY